MQKEFKMSSMAELTYFYWGFKSSRLLLDIVSKSRQIWKDISTNLTRTLKPTSTPIEAHKSLGKDEEGEDVDVHLYRFMIGCLMYLTASRPDIMFAICLVCKVQVTPSETRLGTNHDRRSTSGGSPYLGRRYGLLAIARNKQLCAISSIEVEYVAAASCCSQSNESTQALSENPSSFTQRTKHIQIRHHFIRDCYEQRLINVVKVHTDDNVADLLTKGFDLARFNFLVNLPMIILQTDESSNSWRRDEDFGSNALNKGGCRVRSLKKRGKKKKRRVFSQTEGGIKDERPRGLSMSWSLMAISTSTTHQATDTKRKKEKGYWLIDPKRRNVTTSTNQKLETCSDDGEFARKRFKQVGSEEERKRLYLEDEDLYDAEQRCPTIKKLCSQVSRIQVDRGGISLGIQARSQSTVKVEVIVLPCLKMKRSSSKTITQQRSKTLSTDIEGWEKGVAKSLMESDPFVYTFTGTYPQKKMCPNRVTVLRQDTTKPVLFILVKMGGGHFSRITKPESPASSGKPVEMCKHGTGTPADATNKTIYYGKYPRSDAITKVVFWKCNYKTSCIKEWVGVSWEGYLGGGMARKTVGKGGFDFGGYGQETSPSPPKEIIIPTRDRIDGEIHSIIEWLEELLEVEEK
ncbi:hypothetical protein Tco_1304490 [Tanacetum coccineum]